MLSRQRHQERLFDLLEHYPVVAILGARQVGKTTLARSLAADLDPKVHFFDLEDPDDLARLAEPKLALEPLEGIVVLDEVQRRPEIFPILRVLADRPDAPARFLVLGSASPDLLRQSSETLAGRVHFHRLDGFDLDEVGSEDWRKLWTRGGFPRSFLAENDHSSFEWRDDFIRTFLERDLPQLGIRTPGQTLRRFWTMLAHNQAQIWNGADLARAFGVSAPTVRRYLDHLTSAMVVRQLLPWHANVKKRQVKSPKVYIADSGLVHTLLGLKTADDILGHPVSGASWEGFVVQQIQAALRTRPEDCFFWATHAGAEIDLFVMRGNRREGFEVKLTTSPRTTRSMRQAQETLQLDRLVVVHAGSESFPLADGIDAVAASRIWADLG
ncbi:MAG: ATP-binding protein [Acidobacteriota bacterium]